MLCSCSSFGVILTLSLFRAGTYEVCMVIFPGTRIIDVLWIPGPKKGKILTLKLCFSVTRCVALSPSQKDTSPSSIFNLIRIRSGRCSTCSAVRSFAKAVHTPLLSPIHHTPRFGDSVNFFLRNTSSLHTPTIHEGLSPTITSHRCLPEVYPSAPRTKLQGLKRSGLLGMISASQLSLMVVRSASTLSQGEDVFGSNTTGSAKETTHLLDGRRGFSSPRWSFTHCIWHGPAGFSRSWSSKHRRVFPHSKASPRSGTGLHESTEL